MDTYTRRDILSAGLGTAAAMGLSRLGIAQSRASGANRLRNNPTEQGVKALKIGLQTYSFRTYSWPEAVTKAHEIGIKYLDVSGAHMKHTVSEDGIKSYEIPVRENGITVLSHGVVQMTKNAEENRAVFVFAHRLRIPVLTIDIDPEAIPQVCDLCDEFGIKTGIHNHGPGHRYGTIAAVQEATDGRTKRFGACVDTGHYLRSKEDPIVAIRTFGDRVHGVHLKDFTKGTNSEQVVGEGDLDIEGVYRALLDVHFTGLVAIEYEAGADDPVPGVKRCLANAIAAAKKLGLA
jgi:inosose dehydratase